ncbi:MAG: hypothetical protein OSB09_01810 [Planctomycetota bacterium]|nr:hypothetical protein [Planctomycetota bacterium]
MLKRIMTRSGGLAIAILLLASIQVEAGSEVGDTAPALNAGGWINIDANTSWDSLQGKLILIEKWATW